MKKNNFKVLHKKHNKDLIPTESKYSKFSITYLLDKNSKVFQFNIYYKEGIKNIISNLILRQNYQF